MCILGLIGIGTRRAPGAHVESCFGTVSPVSVHEPSTHGMAWRRLATKSLSVTVTRGSSYTASPLTHTLNSYKTTGQEPEEGQLRGVHHIV